MSGHQPDTLRTTGHAPDNMLPRATTVVVDTPHPLDGTNPGRDLIPNNG